MQSNTPWTPPFILFRGHLINHDLFVQLFCQHQLYLLSLLSDSNVLSPKDKAGALHFPVLGMDVLMFGPILPKIPYKLLVLNQLIGVR